VTELAFILESTSSNIEDFLNASTLELDRYLEAEIESVRGLLAHSAPKNAAGDEDDDEEEFDEEDLDDDDFDDDDLDDDDFDDDDLDDDDDFDDDDLDDDDEEF